MYPNIEVRVFIGVENGKQQERKAVGQQCIKRSGVMESTGADGGSFRVQSLPTT